MLALLPMSLILVIVLGLPTTPSALVQLKVFWVIVVVLGTWKKNPRRSARLGDFWDSAIVISTPPAMFLTLPSTIAVLPLASVPVCENDSGAVVATVVAIVVEVLVVEVVEAGGVEAVEVEAVEVEAVEVEAVEVEAVEVEAVEVEAVEVEAGGVEAVEVEAGGVEAVEVEAGVVEAAEVEAAEVEAAEVEAGAVESGGVDVVVFTFAWAWGARLSKSVVVRMSAERD
jgi:hypothetical protein